MKTIPEQNTNNLIQPRLQRIKFDSGAICFFALGMFLAAMTIHEFGLLS